MSTTHTEYLQVLRKRRDDRIWPSTLWAHADFELRAVADAFHSVGDISYEEMLGCMDSTHKVVE